MVILEDDHNILWFLVTTAGTGLWTLAAGLAFIRRRFIASGLLFVVAIATSEIAFVILRHGPPWDWWAQ